MNDAQQTDAPAPAAHPSGARADVHRLFAALIKLALAGEAAEAASWRAEAQDAQLRVAAEPVAVAALRVDDLWALAVKTAESDPVVRRGETVNPMLPTVSPLAAELLAATPFELENAVQTIRDVASFG